MDRLFDWLISGSPSATIASIGSFIVALTGVVVALRRQSHREHKAAVEATQAQLTVIYQQLNGQGLISTALANLAQDVNDIKRKLKIDQ